MHTGPAWTHWNHAGTCADAEVTEVTEFTTKERSQRGRTKFSQAAPLRPARRAGCRRADPGRKNPSEHRYRGFSWRDRLVDAWPGGPRSQRGGILIQIRVYMLFSSFVFVFFVPSL